MIILLLVIPQYEQWDIFVGFHICEGFIEEWLHTWRIPFVLIAFACDQVPQNWVTFDSDLLDQDSIGTSPPPQANSVVSI